MRVILDIPLTAKEVCEAVCARSSAISPKRVFYAVSTDSREIKSGDLFFALKGERFNGEDFLDDIFAENAIPITEKQEARGICVVDTGSALLALAAYYKSRLMNLQNTIAVTGSVGKTTTKEFLGLILSGKYKVHKTSGNFNNKIGLPLTILCAPKDTEILLLEMGMNRKGEISELSKCAHPDIAVITNIGTAHIGNLGSRENIAKAKLEILDGMPDGRLILPKDEPLLESTPCALTFSTENADADIYIIYNEGKVKIKRENEPIEAAFGETAAHNLKCLAAAVSAAAMCDINNDILKRQISKISTENTRQSLIHVDNFFVLSDLYNSSLESAVSSLEYLVSLDGFSARSALLGDILELGCMAEQIHRRIGEECAKRKIRTLYLFGRFSKFIKEGAVSHGMNEASVFINEDTEKPEITAKQIQRNYIPDEVILFKASRAVKLERVLKLLKKDF